MNPLSFSARPLAIAFLVASALVAAAHAQTSRKTPPAPPAAPGLATKPVAEKGMLRVACGAEATGARVTIDGVFKGECPFDMPLAEGSWTLRAVKPVGSDRERVYESRFELVGGTAKRVEVELGKPSYTPEGLAAAIERMMAPVRARSGPALPQCPDCPRPFDLAGRPSSLAMPGSSGDPKMQGWLQDAGAQVTQFFASKGADPLFRPPASAQPLPCANAETSIRATTQMSVGPVKIWMLQGNCNAQRELEGPVDYWASGYWVGTGVSEEADFSIHPMLWHFVGTMANGKPVGEERAFFIQGDILEQGPSIPAGARAPSDLVGPSAYVYWRYTDGSKPARFTLNVNVKLFNDAKSQALLGNTVSTSIRLPSGPDRSESAGYEGTQRVNLYSFKGGQFHGESKIFNPDGSIKSTGCWMNNRSIKMTPCVVD